METRKLKVNYRIATRQSNRLYGMDYIQVPAITLSGKWLEKLGFDIDTPIAVECSDGRLVITRRAADVQ